MLKGYQSFANYILMQNHLLLGLKVWISLSFLKQIQKRYFKTNCGKKLRGCSGAQHFHKKDIQNNHLFHIETILGLDPIQDLDKISTLVLWAEMASSHLFQKKGRTFQAFYPSFETFGG